MRSSFVTYFLFYLFTKKSSGGVEIFYFGLSFSCMIFPSRTLLSQDSFANGTGGHTSFTTDSFKIMYS